jgi:hypothetical protein
VASDRDRHAAQLRRGGLSYEEITEWLGFTDRRAAHRGVARGLAEPAADEAMIRGLAVRNMNARLRDLQGQMFAWLEQAEPRVLETLEGRAFYKVLDAMVRVSVQRCRLHGMFVHPWRYDQWYRQDVPLRPWWELHRLSAELERQARIPLRLRSPTVGGDLAPVVVLRPVPELDVGMESLVPASVRALLAETA